MAFPVKKIPGLGTEDFPRYTIQQWETWEGKWELIGGYPFAMTPAPSMRHQTICWNLVIAINQGLENCANCRGFLPVNLKVNETTVLQPDLIISCNVAPQGIYMETTPLVSFEVFSPGTRNKDRLTKSKVYAAMGIRYYVIIDPDSNLIEIFELKKDVYELTFSKNTGDFTFQLPDCTAKVDFSEIWP